MSIQNVNNHLADAEDQAVKALVSVPSDSQASTISEATAIAAVHAQIAQANALMALAAAIRDQ